MKTKLFFFDLDGTLLTSRKTISPATYDALAQWHAAGHRIAVSSGRPLFSVLDAIRDNALMPFSPIAIAFNGGQIYDCAASRSLHKETLDLTTVRTICEMARETGLHIHAYDDTRILTPASDKEIEYYTRVVRMPVEILPDFPDSLAEEPCKLLCVDLDGPKRLDAFAGEVITRFSGHSASGAARNDNENTGSASGAVSAMRSNPYYLEIFPATSGKGAAVGKLASILGIDPKDTYAAGDEQNDLSMLRSAGCGIAMCNGNPELFTSADLVTEKDNDHDGLAPLLLRFPI